MYCRDWVVSVRVRDFSQADPRERGVNDVVLMRFCL